jgi:hypothetical protein
MNENDRIDDAPEITPQVLHLRDLLKWVRQGRVRVPNFQRDFTWDRTRMLNLFDSIRKQYPIGTLLFWESSRPRPMLEHLGPLSLPEFSGGKLLVLDGQQRLTTLAGVLLFDEMSRDLVDDKDPERWHIWYDAATDDFVYFSKGEPPSAVKVSDLMGTKGLYTAAQRIMTSDRGTTLEERELWVNRIEVVSSALGAYRLPLVIFATESIRLAVESFTRLNRSGQSMGADEMFSALTYDEDTDGTEVFRLSKHIDSILSDIYKTRFGNVDRVVVLRIVLLAAGLDPFRTEWDELAAETQRHAAERLPAAIQEARLGLLRAVEFLKSEGVLNSRLLPYSIQLVGLAAFFGIRPNPSGKQYALLQRWLWVGAFTEGFGGLNPSRILRQLKDLRNSIPYIDDADRIEGIDLDEPAHPFPERHDHRSARVRALLCVVLRNPVLRSDGSTVSPVDMAADILERGPEALSRICARVENRTRVPLAASPANRIFDVFGEKVGQAKNWLVDLDPSMEHDGAILKSHNITTDAIWALKLGDHRTFVELRTETLMALERAFMDEKGVGQPITSVAGRSAIDVEDEVPLSDS